MKKKPMTANQRLDHVRSVDWLAQHAERIDHGIRPLKALSRFRAEARVEALHLAAFRLDMDAEPLLRWMRQLPIGSAARTEKSLRAGEILRAADTLRRLAQEEGV